MLTRILNRNNTIKTIRYLRNNFLTHSKCCSTKKESFSPPEEFTPIYKFPYIKALSTLSRLKVYQTFLTCLSIPGSVILNQFNLLSGEGILVTSSLGLSGCMVLYSLSYITENFVGFIYLNETKNVIKLSYLDYWGKRKDEIVDVNDIVPLSDLPFAITDGMYLKLTRFSSGKYYKFNVKFGTVLDDEKFKEVFK